MLLRLSQRPLAAAAIIVLMAVLAVQGGEYSTFSLRSLRKQEQAEAQKEGKPFNKRRPGAPWKPAETLGGLPP